MHNSHDDVSFTLYNEGEKMVAKVDNLQDLKLMAKTLRALSLDAVQTANSGHPGLPLGCAELMAYLYLSSDFRFHSGDPCWLARDQFVLSAGHGSALLYSALHLMEYDISLEDLKQFRQLDSKCPGHPEFHIECGVEATTGPLGQGLANAVGMAVHAKMMEGRFGELFKKKVYALAGDGCLMEGISHEALSFAGHYNLDNLVIIYDYNRITLDADYSVSCSDAVKERMKGHNFDVIEISDGNSIEAIAEGFAQLEKQTRPVIIILKTTIGLGLSPKLAGTHFAHGAPAGAEEVANFKKSNGLNPDQFFYVPASLKEIIAEKSEKNRAEYEKWMGEFSIWKQENPTEAKMFDLMDKKTDAYKNNIDQVAEDLKALYSNEPDALRSVHGKALQILADRLPQLIGGSADLSASDKSRLNDYESVTRDNFGHEARNIPFGVREFAMAAITNAIAAQGMFISFCATFFTFSDYMRNAVRLAALSHYPSIFVYTHDSIFVGEDGPTHQPIEHLASLRAMPNLIVFRPCDSYEVAAVWTWILNNQKGPVAIVLTRQKVAVATENENFSYEDTVAKGAYVIRDFNPSEEKETHEVRLFASGSEVSLAIDVARYLVSDKGCRCKVVSVTSFELFDKLSDKEQQSILGKEENVRRISIEAASTFGWNKFVSNGLMIGIDTFGHSAKAIDIQEKVGLTVDHIIRRYNEHKWT